MWEKAVHELVCQMRKSKAGEFDIREHLPKKLSFNANTQECKYCHKKQSHFLLI